LEKGDLILQLITASKGMGVMKKTDKLYLNNPNLFFALNMNNINEENLRETFFANQMRKKYTIEIKKTVVILLLICSNGQS
jgi:hypothetical protein